MQGVSRIAIGAGLGATMLVAPAAMALPPGFVREQVGSEWPADRQIVGVTFAADGRTFAWERAGRVWPLEADGTPAATPLLDIHDEVGDWWDHGMLGLALDPDFLANGRFYLLYLVDHHHLAHAGTPEYDPDANEYAVATIGRLARYVADAQDDFRSVVPDSRTVLIGETAQTGFPMLNRSHGAGTLAFLPDGSLLASFGDGASFATIDPGGDVGGSWATQALAEGIIRPQEDVGAFRAQMIDSLGGKIVRIDPETGDGLPDNPWYDAKAPRAPRSRVWTIGIRNAYRFTVHPVTSALYVGDVGWGTWEEIDVVDRSGLNCGWPLYEGLLIHNPYRNASPANLDAPNPLFDGVGCATEHFLFRDLLRQDTLDPDPFFPNPCDPSIAIPPETPTFVHTRPVLEYHHGTGPARAPGWDHGQAVACVVGEPDCPLSGPQFGGNASVGGDFPRNASWPAAYRSCYYHADYVGNRILAMHLAPDGRPDSYESFDDDPGTVVHVAFHPLDATMWYVDHPSRIQRIRYVGDPCLDADLDGDRTVDFADLLALLSAWGPCPPDDPCFADLDDSADVGFADLLALLAAWGSCGG